MISQKRFRLSLFFLLICLSIFPAVQCMASSQYTRDYNMRVAGNDRDNLRYVVLTLGRENPVKIALLYNSLNTAGGKIRHLHPLRFLECVFTEEDLKVAIRGIPNKFEVDKKFFGELSDTLNEEYMKGNIPDAFILDFAKNLHIDVREIQGLIHQRKWREFVLKLIAVVPRARGTNRYSM